MAIHTSGRKRPGLKGCSSFLGLCDGLRLSPIQVVAEHSLPYYKRIFQTVPAFARTETGWMPYSSIR